MIRQARLASGLAMLAYVTMHLLNHAMGLVSLAAMERVLGWVKTIWGSYPGLTLLYGSFLVHYGLGCWSLWQRRTLRVRPAEFVQIALGFAIPVLLASHVAANRIGQSFLGTDTQYYTYELWNYFVRAPLNGIRQMVTLVIAWSHAMIGLHYWLRVQPWYERWRPIALCLAVLVPVLALLGVTEAGRQVAILAQEPGWPATALAGMALPDGGAGAAVQTVTNILFWSFLGVVAALLGARAVRRTWQRRHGVIRISYPDGRHIDVIRGTSVLEASRLLHFPHASVCGGRGRCSTCRVRVRAELPGPPPAGDIERRVLNRIRATSNIRLACMLRPSVDVEVTPLLPPFAQARDGGSMVDLAQGGEREIAILFADIRGFTALSEGRLPFDIVFVLNRYFAAMGHAVEAAGGRVDKFIGDGVMALFGIDRGARAGCREALVAARAMSQRLIELNEALRSELPVPLRIGIGVHVGPAIVGEMGYGSATTITAIGDPVNTANRLEELTKEFQCEVVVSESVILQAGLDRASFAWQQIDIRGKQERLAVAVLASGGDLPALGDSPPAGKSAARANLSEAL